MLHHAYYWKERAPDSGPGPVALYVKAWGRRGDTVVIAIGEGFPVGAAWYRLFTSKQPGYGFVDERTPELAIAVVPSARGKGVGSALLSALVAQAREAGHEAISLSVDKHNAAAIRLYEEHGFERVGETVDSLTMRARLREHRSPAACAASARRLHGHAGDGYRGASGHRRSRRRAAASGRRARRRDRLRPQWAAPCSARARQRRRLPPRVGERPPDRAQRAAARRARLGPGARDRVLHRALPRLGGGLTCS